MITIKIEADEMIAVETEAGTFHIHQHMIQVNLSGEIRTVLDVIPNADVDYQVIAVEGIVRFSKHSE